MSLAWAEKLHGRPLMIATYRATEDGVCRKCAYKARDLVRHLRAPCTQA